MHGMEQSPGEPAGIAPHPWIQAVCEQQSQLTSALMLHLKFHVLDGAVSHLLLFSYIWIIAAPLVALGCTPEWGLALGLNVMFPSFEFLVSHLSFS